MSIRLSCGAGRPASLAAALEQEGRYAEMVDRLDFVCNDCLHAKLSAPGASALGLCMGSRRSSGRYGGGPDSRAQRSAASSASATPAPPDDGGDCIRVFSDDGSGVHFIVFPGGVLTSTKGQLEDLIGASTGATASDGLGSAHAAAGFM